MATYSVAESRSNVPNYQRDDPCHEYVSIRQKEDCRPRYSTTPHRTNFILKSEQPVVNDDDCHEFASISQHLGDGYGDDPPDRARKMQLFVMLNASQLYIASYREVVRTYMVCINWAISTTESLEDIVFSLSSLYDGCRSFRSH